ncbi:MAG: peptidyl-prolyl cis-trans isomerase [Planctomycetes bacterium]|nr:peptidyl-prolyl cis-trans isomerase [Planctomycetota bacterium]
MKHACLTILICAAATCARGIEFPGPDAAFHTRSDAVLARVGGIPITTGMLIRKNLPEFSRLYQTRALGIKTNKWPAANEEEFLRYWDFMFRQTLAIAIRDELMYMVAQKNHLKAFPSMLEKRTDQFISRVGGESVLKERGLTREDIEAEVGKQLLIETVLKTKRPPIPPVGPGEARKFYEENINGFTLPSSGYRLRLISIQQRDAEGNDGRAKIEEILEKTRNGGQFEDLAARYSQHPSNKYGGLIVKALQETLLVDIVTEKDVPAILRERLSGLAEGRVTGPIEAEGGYHLVLLEKRFAPGAIPFGEVTGSIMQHLMTKAEDKGLREWVEKLAETHGITDAGGRKVKLEELLGGMP